ncbi:F-box protein: endocytic membrane traffic, recycling ReCYcling 1 [Coemansia sp. IMI 203386]|nr:F-box protein: endocytic membrane traffic, recycling ReCYcling 1 [Coemansia sp. IMI 203386]
MSDYGDDGSTNTNIPSWIALPSPKALLDRTTKFVLNAAHGKSRSLIPTNDDTIQRTIEFGETGIIDWDEEEDEPDTEDIRDDGGDLAEEQDEEVFGGLSLGRKSTLMVLESEILQGKWNDYAIETREKDIDAGDYNSDRSVTPPGMMRVRRIKTVLPPRKRIPICGYSHTNQKSFGVVVSDRSRRIPLISLPSRVIARILELLPVPEMLDLLNSCRVIRRVMHRHEPGTNLSRDTVGSEAYTVAGIRVWRVLIQRMGWRIWYERIRGREKKQRVSVPRSHRQMMMEICGVEDEDELMDILTVEPDLLFKALYDNLYTDYIAFRSLDNTAPQLLWHQDTDSVSGQNIRMRSPEQVAERLDQLQWFGRGGFTHDSDLINRRIVIVTDKYEYTYRDKFKKAFLQADCSLMCIYARVLEHIREGRGCIRLLVDSHPLFGRNQEVIGPGSPYAGVLEASNKTVDSYTFGQFLDGMQVLVKEYSRVVSMALPAPRLPTSTLYCFVRTMFTNDGLALVTLKNLYSHLQSIPVATADSIAVPGMRVVPDEATKDVLYLSVVADVVALLLNAADEWAEMTPVAIPVELGRRCVFSAFEDVISDYVVLERRIIERSYDEGLSRWISKSRSTDPHRDAPPNLAAIESRRRDSISSVRSGNLAHHARSNNTSDSIKLVNFRQRQQQMDEYKVRVLKVLETKLKINLPPEILNNEDKSVDQTEHTEQTEVGDDGELNNNGAVNFSAKADMCLNMVLTNREAMDRLAVFAEAPPDMRLRKLAQDAIESVFCILLQSIGNHVRPAFSKIVAELKDLEHSAMVVMVSQVTRSQGRHGVLGTTTAATGGSSASSPITVSSSLTTNTTSAPTAIYSAQRVQAEKELREKFASAELRFLELIHLSDLVVQMIEIYYKKDLCGFVSETDFLNICNQEKKALEHAVDDSVAIGMDSVIEIILRQTQHILDTEQQTQDYHPDSNVSLTLTPTLACTRAVQFLGESTAALQSMTTQKQMRDVFLGEIGVRLFYVLLENIKRFQITEPGGFQLIADLNLYYDWATSNVDPDTLRFFTALKDLANCFILAPRDLRGFLRDQYSRRTFDGVMRSEEVYDVVACRADYKQIRTQVEGHCDFM